MTENGLLFSVVPKYDASFGCDVSVNRVPVGKRVRQAAGPRPEVGVLNLLYVVACLAECGNSVGAVHGAFSRVICRQRQIEVAMIALQQCPQISNPGVDVLLRVENVIRAIPLGGGGDQLHQSPGALMG